ELNTLELTFLQAVKILQADEKEKAISLHEKHFEQAQAGLDYFKSEKNQDNVQPVSKKNLSPAENKALNNLHSTLKYAPTEQKKMALQRAIKIITKGTFASKGLPKLINDFFAEHIKLFVQPDKFIEKLFLDVLDRYDLSPGGEEDNKDGKGGRGIINPKIVLTQSFS
ncbi:MAG: hypothetical protein LPK19_02390, partial [Hymenobacteraceae bacterium]|nr:hypothetical protein [Hymenobacteraceae bacterium]MDX5395026.1 hypothetical protein [Hymenobacteraceae bacterium]MDX5511060.1 hypothetical protein [Hymenobacteraceae bacterium]